MDVWVMVEGGEGGPNSDWEGGGRLPRRNEFVLGLGFRLKSEVDG